MKIIADVNKPFYSPDLVQLHVTVYDHGMDFHYSQVVDYNRFEANFNRDFDEMKNSIRAMMQDYFNDLYKEEKC